MWQYIMPVPVHRSVSHAPDRVPVGQSDRTTSWLCEAVQYYCPSYLIAGERLVDETLLQLNSRSNVQAVSRGRLETYHRPVFPRVLFSSPLFSIVPLNSGAGSLHELAFAKRISYPRYRSTYRYRALLIVRLAWSGGLGNGFAVCGIGRLPFADDLTQENIIHRLHSRILYYLVLVRVRTLAYRTEKG